MAITLRVCALVLLVPAAMCAVPRVNRYTVADENVDRLDSSDLVPPQDPAVNTMPKEPDVPLLPTCVRAGFFRDPFNCGKFYHCLHSQANPAAYYCQQGLIFNELTDICDDPNLVDC